MTSDAATAERPQPRNDRVLRALRREATDSTPVWFMRQAGRCLPEYREIKQHLSLMEICRRPNLCAEITLQPVRRFDVDAAILYADIMHPLVGVGIDLQIVEGVGPVIAEPIRQPGDTARLRDLEPAADLGFVIDDITCVLDLLRGEKPLIGFAGAPFTLASYLVEGRPSRDFVWTKRLMYSAPEIWQDLMDRLTAIVTAYGVMQVEAGVHALQLFDSWAGALSVSDYARYVQPFSHQVLGAWRDTGIPTIHFGTATGSLLGAMRDAGGDAIGADWRIPLDRAWKEIGADRGVQGNLDPMVLLAPWDVVRREAQGVLDRAGGRAGHIFNTGHGLHPETPPDTVTRLVEFVHGHRASAG